MKIGGFFGLEAFSHVPSHSVFSAWKLDTTPYCAFSNARSALYHLIAYLKPARVWLPSYCCQSLREGSSYPDSTVHYYPLTASLSPDTGFLSRELSPHDTVIGIDYFGRSPDAAFLSYVQSHPDITWIEDCSQALQGFHWGHYTLYSPRKLLGVPDGGILVSANHPLPPSPTLTTEAPHASHPACLRAADSDESHNDVWHAANQRHEASQSISFNGMSSTSHAILTHADAEIIAQTRRCNHAFLHSHLVNIALYPECDEHSVPFGFPIRSSMRSALAAYLASHGVFASHHWPTLPSPAEEHTDIHVLADHLLTLPCDQRYGLDDMARVVHHVRDFL